MKPAFLLLHGAIGASSQLKHIAEKLSADHDVHLFDFPGHGGKEFGDEFSIAAFADAVLHYIHQNNLHKPIVFGYSMGGYVAMYLAKDHPGLFEKIITLGTKFHWDEETAAKEVKMLNADKIKEKVPAFATALKNLHEPNNWKEVLSRTAEMMLAMGRENPLRQDDYAKISTSCLIMLGDRDQMVSLDETIKVYKALPDAQMAVLPATPHPIDKIDPELLCYFLKR